MENRVIEVKFKCQQDAEDLFYSPETHKVYARQRSNATGVVFWCTTSKWSRGYEASCRIREGITMRVLDYKDRVCFEETLVHDDWNGGTSAEKKGPFSDEILKAISEEVAKDILLEDEITVKVTLSDGCAEATAWGCDLTYDYVKINGDYRT